MPRSPSGSDTPHPGMPRPADRELAGRLDGLRRKYSTTAPSVAVAQSIGDLVDRIVRARLAQQKSRDCRAVLVEVFEADRELKRMYLA